MAVTERESGRSARRDATRERVLDAARQVFAERGVFGATVEEICEAAGFTRGAFYSNFADKESVLEALIEREHARLLEFLDDHFVEAEETAGSWRAVSGPDADPAEIVEPLVDQLLASLPGDRLVSLIQTELEIHAIRLPAASRPFTEADRRFRERIAWYIERGLARLGRELTVSALEAADAVIGLGERSVRVSLMAGESDRYALARAILPRLVLAVSRPIG